MTEDNKAESSLDISVVIPVYNEEECIVHSLEEMAGVLSKTGYSWELLAIDDGSTDKTPQILQQLAKSMPQLRILTLVPNAGQSAAFGVGFRNAAGKTVITIDADGQNDPADIPRLMEQLKSHDCCFGYRATRKDSFAKRIGSKLGNGIRNRALHESIKDTGCSLKAFPVELVRDLTMWRGMHRFLGSLMLMKDASIAQIPVNHRPRELGASKYTNWGRLKETVRDLKAVRWMKSRNPRFEVRGGKS